MGARIRNGWLVVPYSGHNLARVYIAVGASPDTWVPAFLDWADGERVAQIRPPADLSGVVWAWLKVGNAVTVVGRVET